MANILTQRDDPRRIVRRIDDNLLDVRSHLAGIHNSSSKSSSGFVAQFKSPETAPESDQEQTLEVDVVVNATGLSARVVGSNHKVCCRNPVVQQILRDGLYRIAS